MKRVFILTIISVLFLFSNIYGQKSKSVTYIKTTYINASDSFKKIQESQNILNKCFGNCGKSLMISYVHSAQAPIRIAIMNLEYAIQNAKNAGDSSSGYTNCDEAAKEAYKAVEIFKKALVNLQLAQSLIDSVQDSKSDEVAKDNYDKIKDYLEIVKIQINSGIDKVNSTITQLSYCN